MSNNYLFTVIIAACNSERLISYTMESIIGQSLGFEDFIEIIVVNDGSSDQTGEVARSYAKIYPENIRVFDKSYGGIASARNVGLRMATGDYINFCEPGGEFDSTVFATVAMFFETENENTSVVALQSADNVSDDEFFDFFKRTRVIDLSHTPGFYHPEFSSYFMAKDACNLLSFNEAVGDFSSLDLLYRILAKKDATVGVIDKVMYFPPQKVNTDTELRISHLLNDFLPGMISYYRDRYDPPLPRYFLTMVMRLFCDIFAGTVRQMNYDLERRKSLLVRIRPILSLLGENMLRGDRYISEDAVAFCLSMKPNPQEFLKENYPEFDCCHTVTAVIPVDGDEDLLTSLRQCHCEQLEILRSDRNSALKKATGEYIMFFEKNDRPDADIFRVMLRRMILERVSICCCGYRDLDGVTHSPEGLSGLVTPAVAASVPFVLSTFMFKTSFVRSRVNGESIESTNPYFFLWVLRKIELSCVPSAHLSCSYKETRSIDQLFGDEIQRTINPDATYYDECNKLKHFTRFI